MKKSTLAPAFEAKPDNFGLKQQKPDDSMPDIKRVVQMKTTAMKDPGLARSIPKDAPLNPWKPKGRK